MRRLLPFAALLVLAVFNASPSFADRETDRVTCFSLGNENYKDADKFDTGLAACSRMTDSGRYKDKALAAIYRARASWKEKKRDLDAALADYDRATKIDPTYAAAYYSRGLIYEKKGDINKERAEYNSALAVPTINRIAQWAQDNARKRLEALADGGKK
jgi:tetratricopeptide (TPR) repeat protein